MKIIEEGWKDLEYPAQVLMADINNVLEERLDRYVMNNGTHFFYCANYYARPGRVICESMPSFPDVKEQYRRKGTISITYRELWNNSLALTYVIDHVLYHERDITVRQIIKQATEMHLSKFAVGPRWTPPGFYRRLLHDLNIKEQINDLHPNVGAKALAAITMGIKYGFRDDGRFGQSRHRLEEILNKEIWDFDGDGLVWCDFNFVEPTWGQVHEHLIKWQRLIIYVPWHMRDRVLLHRRPKHEIRAFVWSATEFDYLMVY
jgi:hypothetical protein